MRWLAAALVFQLALIGLASAPRLSARLTGDEYRVRVQPVDPVDPFRGAYVDLDYDIGSAPEGADPVWVPLEGLDAPFALGAPRGSRPSGTALRCADDDGRVRCGIESFFASQDEARRLERVLGGGAVAVLRIDGAGRAAITGIEER